MKSSTIQKVIPRNKKMPDLPNRATSQVVCLLDHESPTVASPHKILPVALCPCRFATDGRVVCKGPGNRQAVGGSNRRDFTNHTPAALGLFPTNLSLAVQIQPLKK